MRVDEATFDDDGSADIRGVAMGAMSLSDALLEPGTGGLFSTRTEIPATATATTAATAVATTAPEVTPGSAAAASAAAAATAAASTAATAARIVAPIPSAFAVAPAAESTAPAAESAAATATPLPSGVSGSSSVEQFRLGVESMDSMDFPSEGGEWLFEKLYRVRQVHLPCLAALLPCYSSTLAALLPCYSSTLAALLLPSSPATITLCHPSPARACASFSQDLIVFEEFYQIYFLRQAAPTQSPTPSQLGDEAAPPLRSDSSSPHHLSQGGVAAAAAAASSSSPQGDAATSPPQDWVAFPAQDLAEAKHQLTGEEKPRRVRCAMEGRQAGRRPFPQFLLLIGSALLVLSAFFAIYLLASTCCFPPPARITTKPAHATKRLVFCPAPPPTSMSIVLEKA